MIKKTDLILALRGKAIEVTTANNYTLVFSGKTFTPEADQTYIKEDILPGDDNKIGYEDSSNDFQIGIYQLMVNTPRNKSNLDATDIIDVLSLAFSRGTELTVNGQMVRTMESTLTPLDYNPTHLMYALRIKYSVIH